jgi:molecular chaperone GrpE
MSDERTRGKGPEEKRAAGKEGWEGFASEPSEGTLEPSSELEEAMREAAEALDARHSKRRPEAESRVASPPAGEAEADEVASLRQELADARDRLLRLAADFDNFRKRALKDREEAHHFGHQNLVKDLLPSVDNLERAVDLAREGGEGAGGGLLEGVELVLRELHAVLAKHGVTPIEALGQPFDPALHEAMAQVIDATKPPNTVVQVYQRGYQLRARLLRPARVVVSKAPEDGGGGGSNG